MNKDTLIDTLIDYLNHNKDICISKEPKLVILYAYTLVEQTSSHCAYLLFRLVGKNIIYNPHRINDQQVKEISLLIPDYSLVPAVPKSDLMFWTGIETL
jgi:hypothetical protein